MAAKNSIDAGQLLSDGFYQYNIMEKEEEVDDTNKAEDDFERLQLEERNQSGKKKQKLQDHDKGQVQPTSSSRFRPSIDRDRSLMFLRITMPISSTVTKLFGKTFKRKISKTPTYTQDFEESTARNFNGPRQIELLGIIGSTSKIIEAIMRSMSTIDILNYRLVSKHWNNAAIPHLRPKLSLHFFKKEQSFETLSGKRLEKLTDIVGRSLFSSDDTFPCSKFIFHGHALSNKSLQIFLNLQGRYIKELTILDRTVFHIANKNQREHENLIMAHVKRLLIHQAPNLHFLELDIRPQIEWMEDTIPTKSSSSTRNERSPLKIIDPEFVRIHSQEFVKHLKLNEKLQEFCYAGSTSSKIFEVVLRLAPQVKEVSMIEDNYAWLMEPLNRRHLLKHLLLFGQERTVVRSSVMARAIPYNFVCKPNSMYRYTNFNKYFDILDWKPPYNFDTILKINKLLKYCSETIETITWQPVRLFIDLVWLQVMPNVTKLQFGSAVKADTERWKLHRLFPDNFNLSEKFPQLNNVTFHVFEGKKNFVHLIQSWNCEPVLSVRLVQIYCFSFPLKRVTKSNLKQIKVLFPNARVFLDEFYDLKKKDSIHQVLIPDD